MPVKKPALRQVLLPGSDHLQTHCSYGRLYSFFAEKSITIWLQFQKQIPVYRSLAYLPNVRHPERNEVEPKDLRTEKLLSTSDNA